MQESVEIFHEAIDKMPESYDAPYSLFNMLGKILFDISLYSIYLSRSSLLLSLSFQSPIFLLSPPIPFSPSPPLSFSYLLLLLLLLPLLSLPSVLARLICLPRCNVPPFSFYLGFTRCPECVNIYASLQAI